MPDVFDSISASLCSSGRVLTVRLLPYTLPLNGKQALPVGFPGGYICRLWIACSGAAGEYSNNVIVRQMLQSSLLKGAGNIFPYYV
tara:strand:- start:90 stop:347 length:258 start_codon:yes stop_codon:yes gene_type:complete